MIKEIRYELKDLGWNEEWQQKYCEVLQQRENDSSLLKIGRVAIEHKNMYRVITENGEILAVPSGKMKHKAMGREYYPAVGDWVLLDRNESTTGNAIIHGILNRKSKFSRKVAGNQTDEQIIATNIDIAFICTSINLDFNLRRLERYLTMAWESGAVPVILLTKSDLCEDIEEKVALVESVAFGVDIVSISSKTGMGINNLRRYIKAGDTVAFLGSSGVGKSSVVNYLFGEERLQVKDVREEDDKGRHTTTHRELIVLPEGGIVIDTPGMREFQILDISEGIESTFEDIEELALQCRFNDCLHSNEPGCRVKTAIRNGELTQERYSNYLKLKKEARFLALKEKKKERIINKKQLKKCK